MNREEAVKYLDDRCGEYCGDCPIYRSRKFQHCMFTRFDDNQLDEACQIMQGVAPAHYDNIPENDPVHPTHYMLPEGLQVIDVEVAMFGKQAVMSHCLCTSVEYLLRCKQKNQDQDVEKAHWWVSKYLELAKKDDE